MKYLITGSHGFIGSHLRKILTGDIVCVDKKIGKNVEDITIEDLKGVDVVIHLAAYISVPQSWQEPYEYIRNNTVNTLNLAEKASLAGVKKFIFASSSSVYGDPLSPYGYSKKASEDILSYYKDKMKVYSLRFFNVYGKGQNREYSGVITIFLEALKKGDTITVFGDGTQSRDFVFVEDLVKIIKFFSLTDIVLHRPIDIGKGVSNSIWDVISILEDIKRSDFHFLIDFLPERKEIKYSVAANDVLRSILPDFKFTTLEEGLQKLCEQ